MKKRFMHLDKLIEEYVRYASSINESNDQLLASDKGFRSKKLKSNLAKAKEQHRGYKSTLENLELCFIGDLEVFNHGNLSHLAIKNANQDAVSRARMVFLSSLQRFESTISSIEDSVNFNKTVNLAKLSILIAIISTVMNFVS